MKNNPNKFFGNKYTPASGKNAKRRGIAIEMAVVTLLLMFALSTILVTVSLINNGNRKSATADLTDRIFIDSVGESFVDAVLSGEELHAWGAQFSPDYNAYTNTEINTGVVELNLYRIDKTEETKADGTPETVETLVLHIILTPNAERDAYTVTEWAYK